MTITSEHHQLVKAVAGFLTPEESEVAFARAKWSGIAEPGDADAGRLIAEVGAVRALELVQNVGPLLHEQYADALERWAPRLRNVDTALHLRQAARFGIQLITPEMPEWPKRLNDLGEHAPIALWVRGDATLFQHERTISIAGARAATGYGEHVTIESVSGLVDRGFLIVSGAAFGIDGAAHRAALASRGKTIAFLAGGVDRFYPSAHETLLTRIVVEHGLVASEVPPGTAPTKWRFLQRNRLIAAMGDATVVVEAGWRSGSLNTAGHAATLGRPLGAVPGPVTSAASTGCHRLIREYDATCVTTAQEMGELVDPALNDPTKARIVDFGADQPLD